MYISRDLTLWSQSWHLFLRSCKMRSAVTEDRALQGWNPSAGDGPKLAGVALCGRPFRCFSFSLPLPRRIPQSAAFILKAICPLRCPCRCGLRFCGAGGMHKGGLSRAVSISLLWGELAVFASVGGTRPPRRPPSGGNEKGGDFKVYAAEGSSFFTERVTGGGSAFPS